MQVAAVTMASPAKATRFRDQFALPFEMLCDPQQQAYRAFGLSRGTASQVLGTSVWRRGLKAFLSHGVGRPAGDVWQLPGEFVVDAAGVVRLVHYSENSADNTPVEQLIRVVDADRPD